MSHNLFWKKSFLLWAVICLNLFGTVQLLSALSAQPQMVSVTAVSGPIITDTIWTAANSPYVVTDVVSIQAGVTLTIEPGVVVKAAGPGFAVLSVEDGANLAAIGLPTMPITFTSVAESGPDDWADLVVGGTAHFEHVVFMHSYDNLAVYGENGGDITIENSVIKDGTYGMNVPANTLHRLQMSNVTFTNNITNRVYIDAELQNALVANATLTAQPGLDGYQITGAILNVPTGITLTVNSGVTIFGDPGELFIAGHLQANGTISEPISYTSLSDSAETMRNGVIVVEDGSANLNYVVFRYGRWNLGLGGSSGPNVSINNSVMRDTVISPIIVDTDALHRLQMSNVSFIDNQFNRIFIDNSIANTLANNVILSAQPGLEGYWYSDDNALGQPLVIPEGLTMTIEPGVALMLSNNTSLEVQGHLQAVGTAVSPITFTNASTESLWSGIHISGTAVLTRTTISGSIANGVTVNGGTLTATCSVFTNNQGIGVFVDSDNNPSVLLDNNDIVGNMIAGVQTTNTIPVDARYNWWGADDGPGGNGPGSGDAVFGNANYTPWLTAPSTCTPHVTQIVPTVQFAQAAYTATETAETAAITITLDQPAPMTATVVLLVNEMETAVIIFTPNITQHTYLFTVMDDTLIDGDEQIMLRLASPTGATLGTPETAVLTILDN
ncbi:MAG: hypothetical protein KC413_08115, partial [Anaerolineales bacterium]|nr:hypothetical protein [Anaerolineales bacterium]